MSLVAGLVIPAVAPDRVTVAQPVPNAYVPTPNVAAPAARVMYVFLAYLKPASTLQLIPAARRSALLLTPKFAKRIPATSQSLRPCAFKHPANVLRSPPPQLAVTPTESRCQIPISPCAVVPIGSL